MKRSILLTIFAVVTLIHSTQAQFQLSAGPKVGISGSNILIDDIILSPTQSFESFGFSGSASEVGAAIGGVFLAEKELNVGYLWFQPEVLFSSVAGNYSYIDSGQRVEIKEDLGRLDLLVLVGYRLLFLRFYGGPVVNFILGSDSELNAIAGFNREYKSTTIGFQLGAGIKVNNLLIDLKFERVGNADQSLEFGGQSFDLNSRINQYALSFSYLFPLN